MTKLRIAIAGLTACSGCQLSLLNCEDELPELLEQFDFSYFPLACSPADVSGEYDAALVEGCVSMPHDRRQLLELRQRSRFLIAVGTCAAWGGVAALRNGESREMLRRKVYGEESVGKETVEPQPLQSVVTVDAVIHGCPPEKSELISLLTGLMRGTLPTEIDYPVCMECKMRENLCLLTEHDKLCLGPLTRGSCAARCPSLSVPCEGCRGPVPEANIQEALALFDQKGFTRKLVMERLHRFCPEWRI